MVKIHIDKNVADLLTKAFNVRKAKKSVRLMMGKLFGIELELILVKVTPVEGQNYYGEVQLHALVDGKKVIITEVTVRRDLQLEDEEGVDCLPNSTIFEQLTLMGSKTTAWNEFSSTMASAIICLATNQKFNFSKYIFENEAVQKELSDRLVRDATTASSLEAEQDSGGGPRCQETIGDTIAQTRFENVSKLSNDLLLARDLGEDASKQGRRINDIDEDEDIILVNVQNVDEEMFDADALDGEEVFTAGQNENVVE
ncbi:retrovirus-related pol polyprotein from transposon TNT 1-94 [Tanacetum coccineum]